MLTISFNRGGIIKAMEEPGLQANWDKLPKFTPNYVQEKTDMMRLRVVSNPGNYANTLANKWLTNNPATIGSTEFQEDLAGLLVAATVSYMTAKPHVPAQLEDKDPRTSIDRVIATNFKNASSSDEVEGACLQVVSTYGGPHQQPSNINDLIMERVRHKHKHGPSYAKHVELAILVTQRDWKYEADLVSNKLLDDPLFSSYWTILPLNRPGRAIFALNYHPLEKENRGEGQVVVDITDDVLVRHLYLYQQDGKLDNLTKYLSKRA